MWLSGSRENNQVEDTSSSSIPTEAPIAAQTSPNSFVFFCTFRSRTCHCHVRMPDFPTKILGHHV